VSLIPAFDIGVWNAWIFMIYEIAATVIFLRITSNKKSPSPEAPMGDMSTIDKILIYSSKLILIPALIYSIFLPLKLGTMWFYIGLPITLLGIIGGAMMLVDWAKTPPDRPVTRGLYHYSRHPMYVTEFIFFLGASIATASWLFFLFGLIFTVASAIYINDEEQITLEMYGDAYREYMNRTPRWLGIPKSEETNA
jgi:protein-S-isoprenylcysteine O-methyltransferase Ste14